MFRLIKETCVDQTRRYSTQWHRTIKLSYHVLFPLGQEAAVFRRQAIFIFLEDKRIDIYVCYSFFNNHHNFSFRPLPPSFLLSHLFLYSSSSPPLSPISHPSTSPFSPSLSTSYPPSPPLPFSSPPPSSFPSFLLGQYRS